MSLIGTIFHFFLLLFPFICCRRAVLIYQWNSAEIAVNHRYGNWLCLRLPIGTVGLPWRWIWSIDWIWCRTFSVTIIETSWQEPRIVYPFSRFWNCDAVYSTEFAVVQRVFESFRNLSFFPKLLLKVGQLFIIVLRAHPYSIDQTLLLFVITFQRRERDEAGGGWFIIS